ncbi:MAG: hypothetical protein HQ541_02650, partial [Mariniphaga sp.]|nr:hypothetical protein [Mariniphaga sp.]
NQRYKEVNLLHRPGDWFWSVKSEDKEFPPETMFNMISALHHVSGTMPFTYECCHGSISDNFPEPRVDFDNILDMQLILYDEMFDYILENRLIWQD